MILRSILLAAVLLQACTREPSTPSRAQTPPPSAEPPPQIQPEPAAAAQSAAPQPAVPERCRLPSVTGPCKALHRRFHYDAQLGACREFIYGGCQGNANNFASAAECLVECAPSEEVRAVGEHWHSGAIVVGCQVGKDVYPAGAKRVPLPGDCNTCTCRNGTLAPCTKRGCPGHPRCPEGTQIGTSCAQAGTADGCVIVETSCLPLCTRDEQCREPGYSNCLDGVCRTTHP